MMQDQGKTPHLSKSTGATRRKSQINFRSARCRFLEQHTSSGRFLASDIPTARLIYLPLTNVSYRFTRDTLSTAAAGSGVTCLLLCDFEFITEFNEIMPLPKIMASPLFTVAKLQGCDTAQCATRGSALLVCFN